MRFLIADDNQMNQNLMHIIFKPYGTCDIVSNGLEVMEKYLDSIKTNSPYDLICLDILMPTMDGHKTLHKIRMIENEKNIKYEDRTLIMMVTGIDNDIDRVRSICSEADAIMVKPVTVKSVREKLIELQLID